MFNLRIKRIRLAFGLALFTALYGCSGGGSSATEAPTSTEPPTTPPVTVIPDPDPEPSVVSISQPSTITLEASQINSVAKNSAAELSDWLAPSQLFSGINYPPSDALFCSQPSSESYQQLSDDLGGIKQSFLARIIDDAGQITLRDYLGYYYDSINATAEDGSSTTITRPDEKYRIGNKVFYLSGLYGLVQVTVDETENTPSAECGLAIPGNPKNFIGSGNTLYVISRARDYSSSAIIEYTVGETGLSYTNHIVFEDESITDARLFNNTLALFNSAIGSEVSTNMLHVIATNPLALQFTETFVDEEENPTYVEATQEYSYFNNFISASGDYLALSKRTFTRTFTGYETVTRTHCTHYEPYTYQKTYCHTVWDKQDNPLYTEPTSGTINCNGDLASCLSTASQSVNPFIYVAVGRECETVERTRYSCTNYEYSEYQRPTYEYSRSSSLYSYKFENDTFTRIDNNSAELNIADSTITLSAEPATVSGDVNEHNHVLFKNNTLYVLYQQNGWKLDTFYIANNALVKTASNTITTSDINYGGQLSLQSTDNTLYVATTREDGSIFQLDISSPTQPATKPAIALPTEVQEMVIEEDTLIVLGEAALDSTPNSFVDIGTATAFTIAENGTTSENNSVLLGTDYQNFSSSIAYDDQVLTVDSTLKRILWPYSVYNPYITTESYSQNRLSALDISNGTVVEDFTTTLPASIDRSLSYSEDQVFGFNDNFIYGLRAENNWQVETLFGHSLPHSVYPTTNFDGNAFVFSETDGQRVELFVGDNPTATATQLLQADSSFCRGFAYYFDTDRILIAQEDQSLYQSEDDCPDLYSEIELELKGYLISESGFSEWTNAEEQAALYELIITQPICVIYDELNENSQILSELPEGVTEVTCYTSSEYYERINELQN